MGTLTFNHDDVPSWKIIQPIDRNNGVGIESDDSSNPPQLQLERLSLSHKAEAASVVLAGNSGVAGGRRGREATIIRTRSRQ